MVKVDWTDFKVFIDTRALSTQFIDRTDIYHLWAYDGPMAMECIIPQDGGVDVLDFENNYKDDGNKSPVTHMRTRTERNDISMRLCRHSTNTISGVATVTFKIPGTVGDMSSREIDGGYASFGNRVVGDYISEINVKDNDDILGHGAGTIVKSWHDSDEAGYQEGGLWLLDTGWTTISAMGDWGELPAGFYLEIKANKKAGEAADTFYIDVIWGVPA